MASTFSHTAPSLDCRVWMQRVQELGELRTICGAS